jgi:glycosyltransferase involved in cell wall biosynthesis
LNTLEANIKKYFTVDKNNKVNVTSTSPFVSLSTNNDNNIESTIINDNNQIKIYDKIKSNNMDSENIKLGFICNWGQKCGISTYSKYLLDSIINDNNEIKIKDYTIFSEITENDTIVESSKYNVNYCWKRGESLLNLLKEIKISNCNYLIVQHEWGLFPNAGYFMKFITELNKMDINYVITVHSVYEHLDKIIPLSVVKNIVVHSETGKKVLLNSGISANINVIPHGCLDICEDEELWNIFQNPYIVFGYGFGFKYKGVDVAIDAIAHLKNSDPKFKDILYVFICSESNKNEGIHNSYYDFLTEKVTTLNLEDNVILIKGFMDEKILNLYLRLMKIIIFPYIMEENNCVYGSSGAIKIAMTHNVPVIASNSHLFDDLDTVVPRITNYIELATEIDKIFSNWEYKDKLIKDNHDYITNTSWKKVSEMYIKLNSIV